MRSRRVALSITPYAYELLEALSEQEDRSMSYIVSWAIERFSEGNEIPGTGLDHDIRERIKKNHVVTK